MAYFIATHYNTRLTCRLGPPKEGNLQKPAIPPVLRKPGTPRVTMQKPSIDPAVNDLAPTAATLTGYDEQHLVTYLRLLDAAVEGADWREVARIVLHIDPDHEPERARRAWETHLARAEWMTKNGYQHLLRGGAPH